MSAYQHGLVNAAFVEAPRFTAVQKFLSVLASGISPSADEERSLEVAVSIEIPFFPRTVQFFQSDGPVRTGLKPAVLQELACYPCLGRALVSI